LKKIYVREEHWNAEALQATVRRFPSAMEEQKNDYGTLPLNYTVRQALNFIEDKVSDRVKKQKAYIGLMSSITARAYVPSTDGPVVYLKAMEHDKHCIDILSGSSTSTFEYSWETLIINCQTRIRSSEKHNNIYLRIIEDKWETDVSSDGRWERFKALYIKELQQLTDDDIGVDNTAMKAQQALITRVDAFESKYESDVQTLNDNQLHLETAFQASGVPSVVETNGTGTVSGSIAGTTASGVVSPTAPSDLLREMRSLTRAKYDYSNNTYEKNLFNSTKEKKKKLNVNLSFSEAQEKSLVWTKDTTEVSKLGTPLEVDISIDVDIYPSTNANPSPRSDPSANTNLAPTLSPTLIIKTIYCRKMKETVQICQVF
jgi:hypothetical protein